MPNEHIEHFKRFSACYLMWANSNFDRIVSETVKKHKEALKEETKLNNPTQFEIFAKMLEQHNIRFMNSIADELMKDLMFSGSTRWSVNHVIKL